MLDHKRDRQKDPPHFHQSNTQEKSGEEEHRRGRQEEREKGERERREEESVYSFLSQIKERREREGVGEQRGVFMYDDDYD